MCEGSMYKILLNNGLLWKDGAKNFEIWFKILDLPEKHSGCFLNVLIALRKNKYAEITHHVFHEYTHEYMSLSHKYLSPKVKEFMKNTELISKGAKDTKDAKKTIIVNLGNDKNLTNSIKNAFITRHKDILCSIKSYCITPNGTEFYKKCIVLSLTINEKELCIDSVYNDIFYYDDGIKTICGSLKTREFNKIYKLYTNHKTALAKMGSDKAEAKKRAELEKVKNELFRINNSEKGQLSLTGEGGELEISAKQS